jgi:hypothetical protein
VPLEKGAPRAKHSASRGTKPHHTERSGLARREGPSTAPAKASAPAAGPAATSALPATGASLREYQQAVLRARRSTEAQRRRSEALVAKLEESDAKVLGLLTHCDNLKAAAERAEVMISVLLGTQNIAYERKKIFFFFLFEIGPTNFAPHGAHFTLSCSQPSTLQPRRPSCHPPLKERAEEAERGLRTARARAASLEGLSARQAASAEEAKRAASAERERADTLSARLEAVAVEVSGQP